MCCDTVSEHVLAKTKKQSKKTLKLPISVVSLWTTHWKDSENQTATLKIMYNTFAASAPVLCNFASLEQASEYSLWHWSEYKRKVLIIKHIYLTRVCTPTYQHATHLP